MNPYGKMVFATVQGDLHDIAKNLVIMMLEGAGFNVIDLGIDVPPETIVAAIRENNPHMLGLSALLTTTMPMVKTTIDTIIESGLRDRVKILVGVRRLIRNLPSRSGPTVTLRMRARPRNWPRACPTERGCETRRQHYIFSH
jgi:5-methyltetrahydrofolate--homocysteine methyltransferase